MTLFFLNLLNRYIKNENPIVINLQFAKTGMKGHRIKWGAVKLTSGSRNECQKSGQRYCKRLKKNRGRLGDTWYRVPRVQGEHGLLV
jgi:hypothetical protein